MGLDNPLSDLLHGYNGPIQRGLQKQNERGRFVARRRQHRRRYILHRYRTQFSHHLRRRRWRSRFRSEGQLFSLLFKVKTLIHLPIYVLLLFSIV